MQTRLVPVQEIKNKWACERSLVAALVNSDVVWYLRLGVQRQNVHAKCLWQAPADPVPEPHQQMIRPTVTTQQQYQYSHIIAVHFWDDLHSQPPDSYKTPSDILNQSHGSHKIHAHKCYAASKCQNHQCHKFTGWTGAHVPRFFCKKFHMILLLAQLVARRTHDRKVVGSIPTNAVCFTVVR